MARKFFVGGNWKCNGTIDEVKKIVNILNEGKVPSQDVVEVVVSPPYVFLPLVKSTLRPEFHVAAQNCWVKKGGAFTGEISADMLKNLEVPWVILGHSERRALLGETNEFVGDKVAYALSQGLKVIACVGETLEQREAGSTVEVVAAQTKAIAEKVKDWTNIVLAYEPVWAIGTGKVASPAQAQENKQDVELWLVDKAVLPIENSVGGSIHRNYDLLLRHRLHIVGEVQLQVNHCLLGLHGVTKEELKRVLSHPQALAQCEMTLTTLGIVRVNTDDTALAAQMVASTGLKETGAVASSRAAEIYGLQKYLLKKFKMMTTI